MIHEKIHDLHEFLELASLCDLRDSPLRLSMPAPIAVSHEVLLLGAHDEAARHHDFALVALYIVGDKAGYESARARLSWSHTLACSKLARLGLARFCHELVKDARLEFGAGSVFSSSRLMSPIAEKTGKNNKEVVVHVLATQRAVLQVLKILDIKLSMHTFIFAPKIANYISLHRKESIS
jgi:hypothetical protein